MENSLQILCFRITSGLDRWAEKKSTIWLLFLLAVVTRLIGAAIGGARSEDDDHWHLKIAQNYLGGRGFRLDTEYGPTYSYIQPSLAAIHVLFITLFDVNYVLAERVFLLIFSSVSIVFFYFLCAKLFSRGCALLGTLMLIFYPPQWFWMTRLNPHSFGTNTLILAFLVLYFAWEQKSFWLAFVTGCLWGALTFFRPEYELGVFFMMLASWFFFKKLNEKLLFAGLLFLGWATMIAPWAIRNYKIHGSPVLATTHYGINVWMVFSPDYKYDSTSCPVPPEMEAKLKSEPNEVGRARIYVEEAKKNILANPGLAIKKCVFNFLTYWRPWLSPKAASIKENIVYVGSYLPVFILFLIGLFHLPWKDPRWIALYTFMTYKMLAHIPFYMIVRFREATFPLMLLFALIPLQRFIDKCPTTRDHE